MKKYFMMLKEYFNAWQDERYLRKVALENRIDFDGRLQTLSINGLVVYEFGYLLRFYSEGKIDHFDDFNEIYQLKDELVATINGDILSGNPKEAQLGMVSAQTALFNLRNLSGIIHSICNYTAACISRGVKPPADYSFSFH